MHDVECLGGVDDHRALGTLIESIRALRVKAEGSENLQEVVRDTLTIRGLYQTSRFCTNTHGLRGGMRGGLIDEVALTLHDIDAPHRVAPYVWRQTNGLYEPVITRAHGGERTRGSLPVTAA